MRDNTVIVLDLGQYRKEFQEKVPFKAIVEEIYDHEIWVKSLVTGNDYELYHNQILESLDIEEIEKLLNLDNYGTL